MNNSITLILAFVLCAAGLASADTDRIALKGALEALKSYEFGNSRADLITIENAALAAASEDVVKQDIDNGLRAVIEDADATKDGKRFACRVLGMVASPSSLEALVPLLHDPEIEAHAMRALEVSTNPLAEAILARELYNFEPPLRDSLLMALARKGSDAGINFAKELLEKGGDENLRPAGDYLGGTGSAASCSALFDAYAKAPAAPLLDGCTQCAQSQAANADLQPQVYGVLKALFANDQPSQVRASAILEMAALPTLADEAQENERQATLAAALNDANLDVVRARATYLARSQDTGATAALIDALASATPERSIVLLEALRRRADTSAAGAVLALVGSGNAEVSASAVQALDAVGTVDSVKPLLDVLTGDDKELARKASDTLVKLGGAEITAAIAGDLAPSDVARRGKVLEVLGLRGDASAKDAVKGYAFDEEREVFEAAQGAMARLGGAEDLSDLLDGALTIELDRRKREVFSTIVAIATRLPEETRNDEILKRLEAAKTPEERAPLIELLGRTGGQAALDGLRSEVKTGQGPARLAAVEGLGGWTSAEPVADLLAVLKTNTEGPLRDAAYAGAAKLLTSFGGAPEEVVDAAAILRKNAKTDDERKLVLKIVGAVPTLRAFNIARDMAKNDALRTEAEQAMLASGRDLAGAYGYIMRARMLPLSREGSTEEIKAEAKAIYDLTLSFGDYVGAWAVSGPYTREGMRAPELYEAKFAPEDGLKCGDKLPRGHKGWSIMPMGTDPANPGYIDLAKKFDATECVAYLRSCFEITAAQIGRVAVGSNDGFKLWHNGEFKAGLNEPRSYEPDKDLALLDLSPGTHTLVLAVYNHGGAWGASVKITDPQGGPLTGLSYLEPI
ncbi:MAG: hypothetical protein GC168_03760 [Candidatus Hydrogenedens sp.]|nr:hypothetical protein [Candidatus Hydrogenedens sp.]